jgi:hypothetical protein
MSAAQQRISWSPGSRWNSSSISDALFLPLPSAWSSTPSKATRRCFPPKKYAPKRGSGYGGGVFIDLTAIYHIFRKNQRFSRQINALDGHKMACPLTGRRKFFVIG